MEILRVKNMNCSCCCELLAIRFAEAQINVLSISQGKIALIYKNKPKEYAQILEILHARGMDIIHNKEAFLVEQIKECVFDIIHRVNNMNSIINKSDYLVEKTKMSYQSISKVFSKHTGMTLEKYIILNKIERIKILLDEEEFTVSEIAYMMDYSSVQYLSNQFKKHTGYTVSEYKLLEEKPRVDINNLV